MSVETDYVKNCIFFKSSVIHYLNEIPQAYASRPNNVLTIAIHVSLCFK